MHQCQMIANLISRYVMLIALMLRPASLISPADSCRGMRIHVLDTVALGQVYGLPDCQPTDIFAVDPSNGIVYLNTTSHHAQHHLVHHKFGTHAAPWYMAQAVMHSACHTADIDSSDLVLVDDYCYYTWWLAEQHTMEDTDLGVSAHVNHEAPVGPHLIKAWQAVLQTEKWKSTQGANFVFFDAHPGFMRGALLDVASNMLCADMRNSFHLIMDGAMRSRCGPAWDYSNSILTPYNPGSFSLRTGNGAVLDRPSPALSDRPDLVYFHGTCTGPKRSAKPLRMRTFEALNDLAPDVLVTCTDVHGRPQRFKHMLAAMEGSRFCLVLPGDAQSTRRLSEIFLAGCVPVFVGPPYNSMPLAEVIDYPAASVIFNVTNTSGWLAEPAHWADSHQAASSRNRSPAWWLPDIDAAHAAIQVDRLQHIEPILRDFPRAELERKLALMMSYRRLMTYEETLQGPETAVHKILEVIAHRRHRRWDQQMTPALMTASS